MNATVGTPAQPGDYSAPVRVAYAAAAKRIGIKPESLEQWVWGHTASLMRFRILVEELVNAGVAEDARLLLQPMLDAIEGAPIEEFETVMPIGESADASEDIAQTNYLIHKDVSTLRRYLSEKEDDIKKANRVLRAGRRHLVKLLAEVR
jgi:hypothetical protein